MNSPCSSRTLPNAWPAKQCRFRGVLRHDVGVSWELDTSLWQRALSQKKMFVTANTLGRMVQTSAAS